MVDNSNLAYKFHEVEEEIDFSYLPDELKYTSVSLKEVFNNKLRLEANAFNLEAKVAKEKILSNKYGIVKLWSKNGLVETAYHRPRFKRIYVDRKEIPFFQPSSITEVYPKPSKYISAKTETKLESLRVKKGMLLMTVSGTIGKVAIVGNKLDNQVFSHDMLRLIGKGKYDTGYIYCYFLTDTGQNILQSNNYGAVIKHIEPEHLQNIIIPNAPETIKKEIHELIIESYDLRDESNDLFDKAESILYEELQLKPIEELKTEYFDNSVELRNFTTKLSDLRLRFDGSFHIPIVKQVETALKKNAKQFIKLSDSTLTKDIVLPGRFSRTYVDSDNGVQFLGGRDLFQLNPTTEKHLSKVVHKKQLEGDLKISKNDILTPSRGTIGKVVFAPEHFSTKAISDNIINIRPANDNIAGFLFSILNSDYGSILIKRQIYGGVVDAMEPPMLASIDIPLLKNEKKQKEINDLVLHANELRYQAHTKEQNAITKMEDIINTTNDNRFSLVAEPEI